MLGKKTAQRERRHKKIRSKVHGTSKIPRLSVFKSGSYIYAQIINDDKGVTLVSADDRGHKKSTTKAEYRKVESAKSVGKSISEKAKEQKIKKVVFDRGGFTYSGRVKALADGAREGGLEF